MARAPPQIELCCNGKLFPIKITHLLERCSLFKSSPKLIDSPEYRVISQVSTATFIEFRKALRGELYSLTHLTLPGLSRLSEEFGFTQLASACQAFGEHKHPAPDDSCSGVYAELILRLAFIEQSQVLLERQLEAQIAEVIGLHEQNSTLTEEVSRLSRCYSTIEKDVGILTVSVDNEIHYRRGCEYFYGTNGYGYRGADISKLLGISELKQAADSGHSDAQYVFGRILRDGPGLGFENSVESTQYIKLSAIQGNSYGEAGYGRALADGYGIQRNESESFVWHESSANHGNARGQNGCGFCYLQGKGVQRNPARTAAYYRLGADQGNAAAINGCGIYCREISKEDIKASEYFRIAASLGSVDGMNSYGWCFEHGLGVRRDAVEGAKWYKKAANEGYGLAQRHIGRCLENGIGVEIDLIRAMEYYKRAADQGDVKARQGLERCQSGIAKRDDRRGFLGLF
jgi:TPR repeat protein